MQPLAPPWSSRFTIGDAVEMQKLGESLALALRPGDIVLLEGEMGAGKTTLAQGLARGLGSTTHVTSPTFVLVIEHQTSRAPLLHLDAYRLEGLSFDEARLSGLEDFFGSTDAIRLVEWPSMIADWISLYARAEAAWQVRIEHDPAGEARQVEVLAPGGRAPSGRDGPMWSG